MSHYNSIKEAKAYIQRAKGYDGKEFIPVLKKYLPFKSKLLELGMGPGTDVDLFSEFYNVTGSDYSQAFLDIYKEKNPNAKLLKLNAESIETDSVFDAIYSNKVLHLLSESGLKNSFENQLKRLHQNGIAFHSFWHGEGEMEHSDMKYMYYTKDSIQKIIPNQFDILEMEYYSEMDKDDSFYIVLRKN